METITPDLKIMDPDEDRDSGFEDGSESDFSVSSSAYQVEQIGHRHYHSSRWETGPWNTLDVELTLTQQRTSSRSELNRQGACNGLWTLILGETGAAKAPLQNPQRVYDVGTGTGIWAMEFADKHTCSKVTGVDFSPLQQGLIPPNLTFVLDNANWRWDYLETFDYVHVRDVINTRGIEDIQNFVENAYRSLKCGGWIEFQEIDFLSFEYTDKDNLLSEDGYREWTDEIKKHLIPNGDQWERLLAVLPEQGFTSINKDFYCSIPMSPLSNIGELALSSQTEGLDAWSLKLLTENGWHANEIIVLNQRARTDLKRNIERKGHCRVVFAQKPLMSRGEND